MKPREEESDSSKPRQLKRQEGKNNRREMEEASRKRDSSEKKRREREEVREKRNGGLCLTVNAVNFTGYVTNSMFSPLCTFFEMYIRINFLFSSLVFSNVVRWY